VDAVFEVPETTRKQNFRHTRAPARSGLIELVNLKLDAGVAKDTTKDFAEGIIGHGVTGRAPSEVWRIGHQDSCRVHFSHRRQHRYGFLPTVRRPLPKDRLAAIVIHRGQAWAGSSFTLSLTLTCS
jgi:hypothetical protein